ncbi:unnamed protein product [Vitrella brassicaformis CCMP3155]|uniref:Uncharacterized protein n=1 Tax=Vitrella brassicaformis (strain CCMP3155) TaxID=1169540 RepID=A0A0G4GWB8_VITBC|nr:unnamed protein product [Vitrella brassicaformis CCMP3155]|eukprot:CEM35035.1 unnamed protein product [Vitrella brassicaformis CCMP3155]
MEKLRLTSRHWTGHEFEWLDPKADELGIPGQCVRRARIPTRDGLGFVDGTVKYAKFEDGQKAQAALFQREAKRMRDYDGNPLFLPLLFGDTDPVDCPMLQKNKDGRVTESKAVAIGMLLLDGEEWIEQRALLLPLEVPPPHNVYKIAEKLKEESTAEEKAAVAGDLLVITEALILIIRAHIKAAEGGLICSDHFRSNIFLRRSALPFSAAQQTSSVPPPPFMATGSTLIPLSVAGRESVDQDPSGTASFRPPEQLLLTIQALEEDAQRKADTPSSTTAYQRRMGLDPRAPSAKLDRIRAAIRKLKGELKAQGVLVGKGGDEKVWMGLPSLVWGIAALIHAVLRGEDLQGPMMDEDNAKGVVRGEVTAVLEGLHSDMKWAQEWVDTLSKASRKGLQPSHWQPASSHSQEEPEDQHATTPAADGCLVVSMELLTGPVAMQQGYIVPPKGYVETGMSTVDGEQYEKDD